MSPISRRAFLGGLGAAALHVACRPAGALDSMGAMRAASDVGVQLYTVRSLMERDMEGTLAAIRAIGYTDVEFAGYYGRSPAEVNAMLGRVGLRAPAAHVPIDLLGAPWERTLADAKTIGHEWLIVPWLTPEQRGTTVADWQRLAARFNEAGRAAKAAGLRFGYHNHDFEFQPVEGRLPMDVLLAETDPALVEYELDVYWATYAGHDPVAYVRAHPTRIHLLHLKDAARTAKREQVVVGTGQVDFAALMAMRGEGPIAHGFVEADNPTDPMAYLRESYRNLQRLTA